MADSASLSPWHGIFAFLITTEGWVVGVHYHDSSPLEKHPIKMWIFILCIFLYGCSLTYSIKCKISAIIDTPYFKLSSDIVMVSGSTACAALISVLVSHTLGLKIIPVYLMLLLIHFSDRVAQTGKKIGSYVDNMWKGVKGNQDPTTNAPAWSYLLLLLFSQ